MNASTVCTILILSPSALVIAVLCLAFTDRILSDEPKLFCLFCRTEDGIGLRYYGGQHTANPPRYHAPFEPTLQWSAKGEYFVLTDITTRPSGFGGRIFIPKVYVLSSDDSGALSRSPRLPARLPAGPLLTEIPARDGIHDITISPRISPGGLHLVYTTYRHLTDPSEGYKNKRTFEIETINLHSMQTRRLTHDRDWNVLPSWSPDGMRIAFVKYGTIWGEDCEEDDNIGLYLMDADGANPSMVTGFHVPQRILYPPIWSPDGESLAYVITQYECGEYSRENEKTALYTVRADGSQLKMLSDFRDIGSPTWSPDGTRIAFGASGGDARGTYVVGSDGTGLRQVHDAYAQQALWSPDGSTLLINGQHRVWLDGSRRSRRLPLFRGDTFGAWAAWSPDGSRLAVYKPDRPLREDEMAGTLFEMAPDGSDARVLAYYDEEETAWRVCNLEGLDAPGCTLEPDSP